jgi:hypothetical protein
MMVSTDAKADTPPVTGTTQGTAGGGTGNASVFNIADLKTNGQGGPLIPGNYDDDPPPNADNHFNVVPNLDDAPLQWANKYVFINNPSGVLEVQKTICATGVTPAGENGPPPCPIIFDDLAPGSAILSGAACLALLGSDTVGPSVANGLITTGQKTATELLSIRNGCQQGNVGILVNPFPISKHLPPGVYKQCVILAQSSGSTSPVCEYFKILPITGFQTDVNIVNYGSLVQFVKSIWGGNFVLPGDVAAPTPGTIQGTGNTSPKLLVAFSRMTNGMGTADPGDDKHINSYFDVQINRQDTAGNIIATQHVDNILGGVPFGPDADLTTGVSTGTLVPICLEPNENLKLDFSVTPQDVLYTGTYTGQVRLTVTNTGVPVPMCTPTLGSGESGTGDSNGVYNNLPGTPVGQTYP